MAAATTGIDDTAQRKGRRSSPIAVSREVRAAGASVALLFAGPAAAALWPDAEEAVARRPRQWTLLTGADPTTNHLVDLRISEPGPSGDDVVFDLTVRDGDGARIDGRGRIASSDDQGCCAITLEVAAVGSYIERAPGVLAHYLRNIADAAEARNTAP